MQYSHLLFGAMLAVAVGGAQADPVTTLSMNNTSTIKVIPPTRLAAEIRKAPMVTSMETPPTTIKVFPPPSCLPLPSAPLPPQGTMVKPPVLPVMPPKAGPKADLIAPPCYTNPGIKAPLPGLVRALPGIVDQPVSHPAPAGDVK